jgi:hypothetical protein
MASVWDSLLPLHSGGYIERKKSKMSKKCFKMFINVLKCLKMILNMFINVPKCLKMFQNVPKCRKMFKHVSKSIKIFQNISTSFKNLSKSFKIFQNVPKCSKMFQNNQNIPLFCLFGGDNPTVRCSNRIRVLHFEVVVRTIIYIIFTQ